MLKKLLPFISLLLGLAAGGAAAVVLAPAHEEQGAVAEHEDADAQHTDDVHSDEQSETEIVKLPNQFVVPVILDNRVRAMVILTVAIEVEAGMGDAVRLLEPKLRDTFLTELFNLAAIDGFKDELITRQTLELVKSALTQRANEVLGTQDLTVLITDMARQDAF